VIAPWSEPEFETIAALVETRAGLRFTPNRCESLERAVRQITRDSSPASLRAFSERLAGGQTDWEQLIARLTVGETYFFRDYPQFVYLEQTILPELARRRGVAYRPRVWSAGCSTGEEVYSIAISLARQGKLDRAFVLGTDLSEAALASARRASFKRWSLRGMAPEIMHDYVQAEASVVTLPAELTEHVQFERLNLAGASYPSPLTSTFAMDVIFCRNVLIYFGPSTIAHVARRLYDTLAPGGVLFVGPSDPPLQDFGFVIEHVDAGTVYRRPLTSATSVEPSVPEPVSPPRERDPDRRAPSAPPAPVSPSDFRARAEHAFAQRDEAALRELCLAQSEPWLWSMIVRTFRRHASLQATDAECRTALRAHPLSAELHYLHGLISIESARRQRAIEALRRAIYLDPALAIAHFTLGSVLLSSGDPAGAARSYQNALKCLAAQPEDEPVPCASEITAGGLASAATHELERLKGPRLRP